MLLLCLNVDLQLFKCVQRSFCVLFAYIFRLFCVHVCVPLFFSLTNNVLICLWLQENLRTRLRTICVFFAFILRTNIVSC